MKYKCNDVSSFKSNVKIYISLEAFTCSLYFVILALFEVLHTSFAIGPCNVLTYNHCSIYSTE